MAQPINYMAMMPQVDLGQKFARLGESIGDYGAVMQKRQAEEQAAQLRQQYASDLQAAMKDGGQVAIAGLMAKYPGQREALGDVAKILDTAHGQEEFSTGMQISSALENGSPQAARPLLMARVEAAKNAGKSPGIYGQILDALDRGDVNAAKGATNYALALLGGDRYTKAVESITKARSQPADIKKAEAGADQARSDADIAAVKSKFAESKAVGELKLNDAQIKAMAADTDIKRINANAAMISAAAQREMNPLKRQELDLRLQEMAQKRDDLVREKTGKVESARSAIDNSINTIDKLFKNPAWKDVVGSFEGRMPESASMMDDKESDAIALINTLGSQVFMSAVKDAGSMTGLTEKEGEKLQNSLAALGRAQSEKAFESNLREAQRLLMKSRQGLSSRYGVPDSAPDIEAVRSPANDMPPPGAVRLKGK